MAFLNATLLFGILAVAIPVALHLLGRREPKRIPFPAVRFLTQRLETNRRRLQVRRWVLMAMRIALLAALAMALARPEVHRAAVGTWLGVAALAAVGVGLLGMALWALAAGKSSSLRWSLAAAGVLALVAAGGWGTSAIADGPQPVDHSTASAAVAILIDNGPTAGYQKPSGQSRIEAAREMATWLISRYPIESRLAVLDRSARPAAFALDAAAVQRRIAQTEPLQTTRPLVERIEAAVRLLRTSDLPRRALFIVTDLSVGNWGGDSAPEEGAAALARLIAENPRVTVQVVDIGADTVHNRWLGQLNLADATPPRGVATTLTVEIDQQRSGPAVPPAAAEPDASGDADPPTSSPQDPMTVELRMFGSEPGLPIERDGEVLYPPLRTVDRQVVSVAPSQPARVTLNLPPLEIGTHHGVVALAESDPLAIDNLRYLTVRVAPPRRVLLIADDPRQREILAAVLNPRGLDDPRREYDIDLGSSASLRDRSLQPYAAIGLFDPALPPTLVRQQLENWVHGGGTLFVALGPAVDAETGGGDIAWPLVGSPERVWRIAPPGTFLQIVRSGHPAVEAFSSIPGGAPWNVHRVRLYWQLGDREEWSSIMKYAGTEHPALAERQLGEGRVIVLTTPLPALVPPSDQWNDLLAAADAWPIFALMHQIFEDLSGGRQSQLNVAVGQPVALALPEGSASRFQWFAPSSPAVAIDAGQGILVPGVPLVAGNYWLRGAGGGRYGYSANLPVAATQLQRIETARLDALLGAENYRIVRDRDDVQWAEGEASDSRSLYAGVMLLAAAIFLLEQILSNRFYPSRRESSVPQAAAVAAKRTPVAAS